MYIYICTVYIHRTRFKHTGYTGFIFQKFQIQVIGQIWPNLMISHDFTPSIATLAENFACACSNLDRRKKQRAPVEKKDGNFSPQLLDMFLYIAPAGAHKFCSGQAFDSSYSIGGWNSELTDLWATA